MSSDVNGYCAPQFESVREAFERNFAERDERGASVCVSLRGETVVDLWGGIADPEKGDAWTEDTVSIVFSNTKAATALCAHLLADRDALDLDAPVGTYWPEYACKGKEKTTVSMLLSHQNGLPAVREPVPKGGFLDWDFTTAALARSEPFWEPGTRHGYQLVTFGWTVGEIVRRVSGKSLGRFFADEIAGPLGCDFWIGLPEEATPHIAPVEIYVPSADEPLLDFAKAVLDGPESLQALALFNTGDVNFNALETHRAEIGGAGGLSNARSLVRMYEPLASRGTHGGVELISRDRIARMSRTVSASGVDAALLAPTRFSEGFMRSIDNRRLPIGDQLTMLIGEHAFGHAGMGGSYGFADPSCGLAMSYTMNRLGPGLLLNERGQSLIDAVYRTLGFRGCDSGAWIE